MNVRYRVELSQTERAELTALVSGGKHAARKLKRAQILLAADAGARDEEIARGVGVGRSTVYRTKRRFVLGNVEAALREEPRPGASRKLSGQEEALLVATACSTPPAGRAPPVCANWLTFTSPRPSVSASSSIICRPTRPARSTKPSRRQKRDGCCADWSSTMSQSMPAG
jgi:Winged helix-turn helix